MKTERTRLRREPQSACYDKDILYKLLDSVPLCHISFLDKEQPYAIPNLQWREGDYIYWHGSTKSRAILASIDKPVCITITRMDGLVLARSAFSHSVNFMSAMILGIAEHITDPALKRQHLKQFVEQLFPGRDDTLRPMTALELKATAILRVPLTEASVKIRAGDPNDIEDQDFPVWAGTIPTSLITGKPIADPFTNEILPSYLENYTFFK